MTPLSDRAIAFLKIIFRAEKTNFKQIARVINITFSDSFASLKVIYDDIPSAHHLLVILFLCKMNDMPTFKRFALNLTSTDASLFIS